MPATPGAAGTPATPTTPGPKPPDNSGAALHVLVVEDHAPLREQIVAVLAGDGHRVDEAADGRLALATALAEPPDVVVLDLGLPGLDGLAVCRQLRERADVHLPVLMLTARDTLPDKVSGFAAGTDDYLVKPFAAEELLARVRALGRRRSAGRSYLLRIGPLAIDRRAQEAFRDGRRLVLPPVPFAILLLLAEAWPRALTRSEIVRRIWNDDPPESDPLRSHLYHLRQVLDRPPPAPFPRPMLVTVHGVGFRLDSGEGRPLMATLQNRLMASLAAFTLAVCALFGLFAFAFVYSVEDRFLERLLEQEAAVQRAHHALHGGWAAPSAAYLSVHLSVDTLPADLQPTLRAEPKRSEVAGDDGRHYHVLALQRSGQPPWLVAEVSGQLIVRPMRRALLGWLAGWGVAVALLSLLLAWAVARGFDALLARTRAFLAREQAFTRDASHELRTPLAVLRVAIERLLARPALEAPLRQQLAPMHAATLLMEQTVQTLLLLAREDDAAAGAPRPPPEPVAVLPLVEQWVLAHVAWLDMQPLTLDIALGRHDTLALPAPVLQLALANLLGNAFAHGQPGGVVRVSMDGPALCIANPGAPPPAGAGEDFVKGEGSAGFGLGLSILRRLLERHGSRLDVQHGDGQTRVRVLVAAAPSRSERSARQRLGSG